ncbi:replication initiation factor domain-containing protein [Bacillus altitudinis]|nr:MULTISPECIES: replication initiation factor domain-containing protein [Bacillus]MDH6595435.1 phage replication initiation protein [Bacillus aerius]QII23658.1 replication initiation factor domain-containing protein [Bacillus altitudinis]
MKTNNVENPLVSMVDYVRVSFKTHDVDDIIENILHINRDFMTEKQTGFYGYVGTWEMDMIKVFYSAEGDDRGTLIELSGKGCRQFESFLECRKKTWFDFFQECLERNGNFTRLDIALDDRKTYFSIPRLLGRARRGYCVSRFRNSDYNGSFALSDGSDRGTTIYFGSKKSDAYMCFYQKGFEQAAKYNIPDDEVENWNRYEIRLKNERAKSAVNALIKDRNMTYIALAVISNYVRFVNPDEMVDRESWKTSKFWEKFIGDVEKLQLYTKPQTDFYEKSRNWLKNSCAPTMRMVLEVDKATGSNDLSDMVINAEMDKKHETMLDVYLANIADMVV